MNIQGPGPTPAPATPPPTSTTRAAGASRPSHEPARAGATEAASLWDLLTPEERSFFQQLAALGPLTYGPNARRNEPATPVPTGRRIDVRA